MKRVLNIKQLSSGIIINFLQKLNKFKYYPINKVLLRIFMSGIKKVNRKINQHQIFRHNKNTVHLFVNKASSS